MLFIGTPTYDGKLHYKYVAGVLDLMHICAKHNIGFAHDVVPGDAFVGHARNCIVHRFLKTEAEDMLFIDADIGFEALDVVKLCRAPGDIVMGLYRMKMEREKYPARFHDPVEVHPDDPNLVRMDYAGAGMLRVKRRVFDAMREKWPEDWYIDGYNNEKTWDYFPDGRVGHHKRSEDIAFFSRAAELGIKAWAMQGMELEHIGEYAYRSSWQLVKPQIAEVAP